MTGHFAAVHESLVGPERRVVLPQDLGRERGIAEVDESRVLQRATLVDPKRSSGSHLITLRQAGFSARKYDGLKRYRVSMKGGIVVQPTNVLWP